MAIAGIGALAVSLFAGPVAAHAVGVPASVAASPVTAGATTVQTQQAFGWNVSFAINSPGTGGVLTAALTNGQWGYPTANNSQVLCTNLGGTFVLNAAHTTFTCSGLTFTGVSAQLFTPIMFVPPSSAAGSTVSLAVTYADSNGSSTTTSSVIVSPTTSLVSVSALNLSYPTSFRLSRVIEGTSLSGNAPLIGQASFTTTLSAPAGAEVCTNAADSYGGPSCSAVTTIPVTWTCNNSGESATAVTESNYTTTADLLTGGTCTQPGGVVTDVYNLLNRPYPLVASDTGYGTDVYGAQYITASVDSTWITELRYPTASGITAGTYPCTYTTVSNNPSAPLSSASVGSCGTLAPTPATLNLSLQDNGGPVPAGAFRVWNGSVLPAELSVAVSNSGSVSAAAGTMYCAKFDNSRDVLISAVPTPSGPASTVEYGSGNWGAASADEAHSSYAERAASCFGTTSVPTWYTASQVDFTNSGASGTLINANQINVVRATLTAPLTGNYASVMISFGGSLRALTTDTRGVALKPGDIHLFVPQLYSPTGVSQGGNAQCTGADNTALTCPVTAAGPTPISGRAYGVQSSGPMSSVYTWSGATTLTTVSPRTQENGTGVSGQAVTFTITASGTNVASINTTGYYTGAASTVGASQPAVSVPNVTVTSVMPTGVVVDCSSVAPAPATCTFTGSGATVSYTLTWLIPSLAQGQNITYTVPAAISPLATPGTQSVNTTLTAPTQTFASDDTSTFVLTIVKVPVPTLTKTASAPILSPGGAESWSLVATNASPSTSIGSADIVDILPFNGDPRGTSLAGSYALSGVDTTNAAGSTVYVSSVAPALLDALDGTSDGYLDKRTTTAQTNAAAIAAAFSCTIAQVGTVGCPATLAAVTAIDIESNVSPYLAPSASKTIVVSITTSSLRLGDTLENTAASQFDSFATNKTPNSEVDLPGPAFTVTKTASPATVQPGGTVHYTVVVKNTGNETLPYSTLTPTITDNLSDVLDDAAAPSNIAAGGGTATVSGSTMTWTPPVLAPGASATLTYDDVVNAVDAGNKVLTNTVSAPTNTFVPASGLDCPVGSTASTCTTSTPVQSFTVTKTASTSVAHDGDAVTYTATLTNTGAALPAGVASFTDNLAGVLDDATMTTPPAVASGGGSTNYTPGASSFVYTAGALAAGATVTVRYTVTVATPDVGDDSLVNTLLTSSLGSCSAITNAGCTLTTPVAQFDVTKTANKSSVTAGDTLTYTVTVKNTGGLPFTGATGSQASFTDDLSSVLNDATMTTAPTVVSGGGTVSAVSGNAFTYTGGALAIGASAVVTYTVTLSNPLTVNADLTNRVTSAAGSGGDCPSGSTQSNCVITTSVTRADLASTKVLNTSPVVAGGPIQYTLTTTNNGPSTAAAVVISDVVPSAITLNSQSATLKGAAITSGTGSCVVTGQTVSCTFPSLAAAAQAVVQINGIVSTTAAGSTISNSMTVTSTTADPTASNNCPGSSACTATGTGTGVASLINTKTLNTATVVAGKTIQWTITSNNQGPSAAQNVTITDAVPSSVTGVAVAPSAGGDCSATAGNSVSCTWAAIGAAGTASVVVTGTVSPSAASGSSVANQAVVTSSTGCNSSVTGACTNPTAPGTVTTKSALINTKTLDTTPVVAGKPIQFTVTSANQGPSDAKAVLVTDVVASSITGVTASPSAGGDCSATTGNTVSCVFSTVAAGSAATVVITGTVKASTSSGTSITNTAGVTSATPCDTSVSGACSSPSSTPSPTTTIAGLVNTKTLVTAPVVAGKPIQFVIGSTNHGPSDAQGVVVADTVPSFITGVSAIPSTGGDCSATAGNHVSCTFATLAAGASATVTVNGTVSATTASGTAVTNTATVSSSTTCDTTIAGACTSPSSVPATVTAEADLVNTKTLDTATIVAGRPIQFTITSSNHGPSDAHGVSIIDAVPGDITGVVATPSAGGDCSATSGNTVSCTFATIADGASAHVIVTGIVAPSTSAGTAVNNSATVTSSTACNAGVSGACTNPSSTTGTVTALAALVNTKTLDTTPVIAGAPIQFTIRSHNEGPSDASAVTITDTVASSIGGVTATPSAGGDCSASVGNQVSCVFATVAASTTAVVTIAGTVAAATPTGTTVANSASIASSTPCDGTVTGACTNPSSVPGTVSGTSALVNSKSLDTSPVVAGGPIQFTVSSHNTGPSDAQGVLITDLISPSITGVTAVPSAGGDCSATVGNAVSCVFATLANGATGSVTIAGTVSPSLASGTPITNTATVTSTSPCDSSVAGACLDPSSNPGTSTASADLAITKTLTTNTPVAGEPISYDVRTANNGSSDADLVTTVDPVESQILAPTGTPDPSAPGASCTTVSSTSAAGAALLAHANSLRSTSWTANDHPNIVTCTYPTLAAGGVVHDTINGTVDPAVVAGATLANGAVVFSSTDDPDLSNNSSALTSAQASAISQLVLGMTTSTPTVDLGAPATFTLTVHNYGPSAATSVVVSNAATGLSYQTSSTAIGTFASGVWSIPSVAVGQTVTLTLVQVATAKVASNTATLTAATAPDPAHPSVTTATASVTVTSLPTVLGFTGVSLAAGWVAAMLLAGGGALWLIAIALRRRDKRDVTRYKRSGA